MKSRGPLALLVAVVIGIAALRKRPVKAPSHQGTWGPAEHQRSPR